MVSRYHEMKMEEVLVGIIIYVSEIRDEYIDTSMELHIQITKDKILCTFIFQNLSVIIRPFYMKFENDKVYFTFC